MNIQAILTKEELFDELSVIARRADAIGYSIIRQIVWALEHGAKVEDVFCTISSGPRGDLRELCPRVADASAALLAACDIGYSLRYRRQATALHRAQKESHER